MSSRTGRGVSNIQPSGQQQARAQNVQRPTTTTTNNAATGNSSRDTFLKKLATCSQVLDFNDDTRNVNEKRERLRILTELSETIATPQQMNNLVLPNLEAVINMIKRNIFRPLPIVKKQHIGRMA